MAEQEKAFQILGYHPGYKALKISSLKGLRKSVPADLLVLDMKQCK
jgi:hypothetical protein